MLISDARPAAPQDLFTPNLTVAKLRQHCIKILRNEEILAQDNPIVRPSPDPKMTRIISI